MKPNGGDHTSLGTIGRLIRSLGGRRMVPTLAVDSAARREKAEGQWAAINYAMAAAHEAETIAQTRLNNFLVGDSVLLLGWCAVFGSSNGHARTVVLLALATLSGTMSLLWAVQGLRERNVIALHWTIVQTRELELDRQAQVNTLIVQLRDEGKATVGGVTFRMSWVEQRISSRALLVVVPAAFSLMSLALFWPSIQ